MALKPPIEGVRVLRGPDWRRDDDADGGEGHLGTVQGSPGDGTVHVLWDVGQESTCRAGQDNKFDLRIFDTATVGVYHPGTCCKECGERDIGGILWRCQECMGSDLCSLCYADDKHDLRHRFLRIDIAKGAVTLMKKRNVSVRIRAMGLFPGAKVTRGKNWEWKDQDGGVGSEGEVLEIIQKSNKEGKRNLIKVLWPNGANNVYRLAYEGHVDVTCTEEEGGWYYYRDHLPCLDTSQFSTRKEKKPGSQEEKAEAVASSLPDDTADTQSVVHEADTLSLTGGTTNTTEHGMSESPGDDTTSPSFSPSSALAADTSVETEHSADATQDSAVTGAAVVGPSGDQLESTHVKSQGTSGGTEAAAFSSAPHIGQSESECEPMSSPQHATDSLDKAPASNSTGNESDAKNGGEKDQPETATTDSQRSEVDSSDPADAVTESESHLDVVDASTPVTSLECSLDMQTETAGADSKTSGRQPAGPTEDTTLVDSSTTQEFPNKETEHNVPTTSAAQDTDLTREMCSGSSDPSAPGSDVLADSEGSILSPEETGIRTSAELPPGPQEASGLQESPQEMLASETEDSAQKSPHPPGPSGQTLGTMSDLGQEKTPGETSTEVCPGVSDSQPPLGKDMTSQATVSTSGTTEGSPALIPTVSSSTDPVPRFELGDQEQGAAAAAAMDLGMAACAPESGTFLPSGEEGATGFSGEISNKGEEGSRSTENSGKFTVGQKAAICVPEETLKELQHGFGGVTHTMIRKIGRAGTVAKVLPSGAVQFRLGKSFFRVNPSALVRVHPFSTGDTVRIREDLYMLHVLNERLGWRSSMDKTAGKVGEVTKVDDDGDLRVSFGQRSYLYSPACCVPAPGCSVDYLGEGGGTGTMDLSDLAEGSISERLTSLFSRGGGGGGGGGRCIRLSDLSQMGQLGGLGQIGNMGDLTSHLSTLSSLGGQLSQLMGGGSVRGIGQGDKDSSEGQLFGAVLTGDVAKVKELCRADPSLIDRPHQGLTPLMLASHQGKRKALLALLDLGADVNAVGLKEQSALITALDNKEEEMALLLLEYGADVMLRNGKKRTPLHAAIFNHQNEAAQILLHMGADINVQDKYGDTPLHDGIARQNVAMVDVLLQQPGIDVRVVNKNGYTPLHLACKIENAQLVGMLLAADSSIVNQLKETDLAPLHICVKEKFLEGVQLLLNMGNADINLRSGRNRLTALHMACLQASRQIVEVLLDNGADVNVQERSGETPLHLAMGGNDGRVSSDQERRTDIETRIGISCLLISNGAFVDAENHKGRPPTTYGHAEVKIGVMEFIEQNPGLIQHKSARQRAAQGMGFMGSAIRPSLKEEDNSCRLCQGECDAPLKPCGHRSVCRACAQVVCFCPICGREVQQKGTDGPAVSDTSERQASPVEDLASVTKEADTSFSLNNKTKEFTTDEEQAFRVTEKEDLTESVDRRPSLQLTPQSAQSMSSASSDEKCPQQHQEVTAQTAAEEGKAQVPAVEMHQAVGSASQSSGEEAGRLLETSAASVSDTPGLNAITEQLSEPVAERPAPDSPALAETPADADKQLSADSGLSPEDEKSKTDGPHPTHAVSSQTQSSEEAAAASCKRIDHLHDVHTEGSESEGNLLRVAICRQFPDNSQSAENEYTAAESHDDGEPRSAGNEASFADEKECEDQDGQDNRALTLKSERHGDTKDEEPGDQTADDLKPERHDNRKNEEHSDQTADDLKPETLDNRKNEEHSDQTADDLKPETLDNRKNEEHSGQKSADLKSETQADAGAGPTPSAVDLDKEDLELPDLPSMPAGGMGLGDWMAMGPGGAVNLTSPQPPPMMEPPTVTKPKNPTASLYTGLAEPDVNPWLSTGQQSSVPVSVRGESREHSSPAGLWATEGSSHSQASKSVQKIGEDQMLDPAQLWGSRAHSTEATEDRSRASFLSSGVLRSVSDGEKQSTHAAHAASAWPSPLSAEDKTSEQTHGRNTFFSQNAAEVGSSSPHTTMLEKQNHAREMNTGGESSSSGAAQEKIPVSQGARPKTTPSVMLQRQVEDTKKVQHETVTKTEEDNKVTEATGARCDASPNQMSPQKPTMESATTHDTDHPNQRPTATTLISHSVPKKKEDLHFDASFDNLKSLIKTENLSAIFNNITYPEDLRSAASQRATMSLGLGALPAGASQRGNKAGQGPGRSGASAQTGMSAGLQTLQRQLSSSDSQLPPGAQSHQQTAKEISRQKSQSAESVHQLTQPADAKTTESSRSQAEASQGRGSSSHNTTGMNMMKQTAADTEELKEGDSVVIGVTEERLVQLQLNFGGTTKGMLQCLGKTGTVTGQTKRGAMCVKYHSLAYKFNPQALMRLHVHKVGDTVRMRADLDLLKLLNKRVGYCSGMAETLGKVGTITSIDQDGDLTVSFGQSSFRYSPACCVPAPGVTANTVQAGTGVFDPSKIGPLDGGSSERQTYMQKLAKMVKEGDSVNDILHSFGEESSAISPLFDAIKHGNLTLVMEMCQNDPSLVNGVHRGHQLTTLMYASWKGQKEIVRALLDMGADVNGRLELPGHIHHHSRLPLCAALESKEEETAVLLLERGADPNSSTAISCQTVLHMAAARNLVLVTQVLLAMGADVNAMDERGDTPLMDAIMAGNNAVAEILLEVPHIHLSYVNTKDVTPLHAACMKPNPRVVEEILVRDLTHVNRLMDDMYAPLHLAAEEDSAEIIRLLALIGEADVNIKVKTGEHQGDTPLHRACLRGHFTCVEALLDFGAEVNVTNRDMDTPLHYAMGGRISRSHMGEAELYFQEERVRIACTLISNGAFVDVENNKGRTCMRYGGMEIVAAVQNFMDTNRHLVQKQGQQGFGGGGIAGSDSQQPTLKLRRVSSRCNLCQDSVPEVTLLPCGHKAVCLTCADKVTVCPVCQRRVDSTTTDDKKAALFEAIT